MPDLASAFARALQQAATALGAPADLDPGVERSGQPSHGDLSSPLAQRLAGRLRRPPQQIAADLAAAVRAAGLEHVGEVTVSGPGYVNLRFDDATYAPAVIREALAPLADRLLASREERSRKTIVEHTQVNPNKAAHVGHLRNACIGDTVVRILRARGVPVEVENYIDDTGVQVADVVVGLRVLGLIQARDEPFDRYGSRVYVEICRRYELEPGLLEERRSTLRAIEAREQPIAAEARAITSRIVRANLATMARLGIGYDLLTWESDILELGFWSRALAAMQAAGILDHPSEGPLAGCWVLPPEGSAAADDPEAPAAGGAASAKVLVKSDGVATYTAKDIAYHLWKFGLLDRDFHYLAWAPGGPATSSATASADELPSARYGHADRVVNVIDQRQSAPQLVVREALRRLGYPAQAAALHHLAYEVVSLSPAAARSLGFATDDGRSMYPMSGRQGLDVHADALVDEAVRRVREKSRDGRVADQLAAAAIRYYLLRFSLGAIITFDFDEALRTTGDTGVYLQYAHARACGILARVEPAPLPERAPHRLEGPERDLVACIDRLPLVVTEAASSLAPALLATYAFQLASAFNDFYEHTERIYRIEDLAVRAFRRGLADAARLTLARTLQLLGIVPLERI